VPADRDLVDTLTRVLIRACRKLGEAGYPQEAGRLTADAWVALRTAHPRQAQHLDGVMHHIARLEQKLEAASLSVSPLIRNGASMPTEDRLLDVRTEIPKRRHELIFESFGELATGDTYVLVNDHDPKPLKYQFEAENAGEFTWEYLEEGPEVWRVRIGRIARPGASVTTNVWPDWRSTAQFSADGPGVTVLHESAELKVVLVALEAGQALPVHPGPAASFHFLDGHGVMVVDDDEIAVSAGATVVAPTGARRAVRAKSALVFLGNLGDPASEDGPH
jgi:uncharacterized protein (DUF2249 family)